VIDPADRHREIMERLRRTTQATGPLVMDAALAAMAIEHGATLYSFDTRERRLTRAGADIALEPKTLNVLAYLVGHAGPLVTKRKLLDALWPDVHVEEGILAVHVSTLRRR
jgi:DNA-binding winged helix-turn-helix (wHTH) protein